MTTNNEQSTFSASSVERPVSDTEYEVLRKQVVKEHDCAFYGGIGHVAVDEKEPIVQPPIEVGEVGPWIGM